MILSFKTFFPWGEETMFPEKILYPVGWACVDLKVFLKEGIDYPVYDAKIHTIRESFRIKPGTILHMATGVRSKNYYQFNKDVEGLQSCISTQGIRIYFEDKIVLVSQGGTTENPNHFEFKELTAETLAILIKNDGFDSEEKFWKFFNKDFHGQLIHWTDYRY